MELAFFTLCFAILSPIPFIYAYLVLSKELRKSISAGEIKAPKANTNLCTLAELLSMQKYITSGFYITGLFLLIGSVSYFYYLEIDYYLIQFVLWLIVSILFLIAGKSVFNHKEKLHNISSRLLIVSLIFAAGILSYQIALENFSFGISLSVLIFISGMATVVRAKQLGFVDKKSQILFHLGFSVWNWLVCFYIIFTKLI